MDTLTELIEVDVYADGEKTACGEVAAFLMPDDFGLGT